MTIIGAVNTAAATRQAIESRRWSIVRSSEVIAMRKKKDAAATQASRQFAIEAARVLADTRCHDVVVLDVSKVSPVTDFFVIGTGSSPRQMKSAADAVDELGEERQIRSHSRSRDDGGSWILLDCFDVVIHLFGQEARLYYDLDGLWGDALSVQWERPAVASAAPASENLSP